MYHDDVIALGYRRARQLPDGTWLAVKPMLFTTGLFVGLTGDTYERLYCYESYYDALGAVMVWDGNGDPPGKWIKEKPSERLNPDWIKENDTRKYLAKTPD